MVILSPFDIQVDDKGRSDTTGVSPENDARVRGILAVTGAVMAPQ